jgi:MoaA/NifB/PqqE/SkfB family radical SAM enzyme/SAM-dependent methyltransferase
MSAVCIDLKAPPRLRGIPSLMEASDAVAKEELLVIGLMTSRRCNLRCSYCYTDAGQPKAGEIDSQLRLRIIREAAALGARLLWIPGEGEPLLDKRGLWDLLDEAGSLGLWTLFYTSGSLVTREDAKRLAAYPCSVVVKLNSLRAEVQDRLAGVPGTWERIHRGIGCLLAEGLADQHRLGGETVILPENLGEIPEIFRYCRTHNIIPYIERLLPSGRASDKSLHLPPSQEDALFRLLASIDREEFGYAWEPCGTFAAGLWSCDRILHTLVVDATGLVHPCVAIRDTFGDVRCHTLKEIWYGPGLTGFRRSLSPSLGKGICFCRESLQRQECDLSSREPGATGTTSSSVVAGPSSAQLRPRPPGYKYLRYTREDAERYDQEVWALVPGYGGMLDAIAAHLSRRNVVGKVIDLGGGTGTLIERLAPLLPKATFELIDFSQGMCQRAREKLSMFDERRCVVQADINVFSHFDGVSIILSTLALHEVAPAGEHRRKILGKLLAALPRGATLILADYYSPPTREQAAEFAELIRRHAAQYHWDPADVEREIQEHLFDPGIPRLEDDLRLATRFSGCEPKVIFTCLNLAVWIVNSH